MATGIYSDLDNNGKKSEGDRFGLFSTAHPNLDIFYMGADMSYVEPNADGDLVLSPDILSEKALAVIDRFNTIFYNSDDGYFNKSGASGAIYAQGNSLFYNITGQILSQSLRSSDMNYSILPAPKYDESQEKYRTAVAFTHTMYCIPIDARNTNKSGAVLECMASEAYRQVNPVYFESMLKLRYAQDERIADMYDLVRESIGFDFCYLYSVAFTTATRPNALINGCLTSESKSWSSTWETNQNAVESQFQTIINAYFAN
jgi:hypothetical protein